MIKYVIYLLHRYNVITSKEKKSIHLEKFLNFYDGIQPYTKKKYMEDLLRVTSGRSDPTLANILVNNSNTLVVTTNKYTYIIISYYNN